MPTGTSGRQPVYSDKAIQTCLMVQCSSAGRLDGRPASMRACPGWLIGLEWGVPDVSILCRQRRTLRVNSPYRGSQGLLHFLIDSTGIKVEGEGEWNASTAVRNVASGARSTLGSARQVLEIKAVEFTGRDVGGAPMLPDLLDQTPAIQEIGSVAVDGTFDTRKAMTHRRARSPCRHPVPKERKAAEGGHRRCGSQKHAPRASRRLGQTIR